MIRNSPPPNKIRSRPEISLPSTVNSVVRKPASQVRENSSAMRVTMANARPRNRALPRLRAGNRSTRTVRKMMLSMPRTISSTANVRNEIQTCGSESNPMLPPLRQPVDFLGLGELPLQQIVGPQAEIQSDRRGYVDRGVGAGDDADHQRRGEWV